MIGGLLRVLVVSLVLLVAAMMLLPRARDFAPAVDTEVATDVATVLPMARELPVASLTDGNGEPLALNALGGRHALLFFGFTHCPDVCPLTLGVLAEAMAELRQEPDALIPEVVFVSVDPDRDSAAQVREYLAKFDPGFIGARAQDSALAPLYEALGVMVHKQVRDGENYNVVHQGAIYLLDGNGRWIAVFNDYPYRAGTIVSDYLAIRRAQ